MTWPVRLRSATPDGLLIGVETTADVPDDVLAALAPDERRFADALPAARRASFVGGRFTLRTAIAELGATTLSSLPAMLPNDRGAPTLPPAFLGSITHKPGLACALVRAADHDMRVGVGVDLERAQPRPVDVSARVLMPAERERVAHLPDKERSVETLARFSAKEALYKAIDPFLRRYVGFHEVAVERDERGVLAFTLHLEEPPDLWPLVSGHQRRFEGWWISTVTAVRVSAGRGS